MSIAPQSISTNLRKMSDQQLAQYAKMHASDPYIFPLAFQESQDRKSMRAEAMAKQSGQAQLPVVQQDLAQMMPQQAPQQAPQQVGGQQVAQLPEDQGIGALPAQNMQGLAGGGITGENHFAGGITPEQMRKIVSETNAQLPKPIEEMTPQEIDAWMRQNSPNAKPYIQTSTLNFDSTPTGSLPRGQVGANQQLSAIGDYFGNSNTSSQRNPQPQVQTQDTTPVNASAYTEAGVPNNYPQQASTEGLGSLFSNYEQKDQPYVYKPFQLGPAPAMGGGMPSLSSISKMGKQIFDPNDYKPELMRLENETRLGLDSMQKERELAYANRPLLGKKQEELLKAQEAKEGEKLDNLKTMSMLDAGLSMMAGESPYAFVNIGKGGREGLKRYTEGIKEIDKAKDLRDQAYAHIDDMRNAQIMNDQDRALDSRERAFSAVQQAAQHTQSGLMNLGIKSADINQHLLTTAMTEQGANTRAAYSANTQRDIANANLAKPSEQMQLATMIGNGDPAKGYKMIFDAQTEKSGVTLATLYERHISDMRKQGIEPLSETEFANKMRSFVSSYQNPQQPGTGGKGVISFDQLPK